MNSYVAHHRPQAARVFSLERDAIEGQDTIAGGKYDTRRADDVEIDYTNGIHEDVLEDNEDFAQVPFCEDSPKLATIRTKAYKEAWQACQADIRVRSPYELLLHEFLIEMSLSTDRFARPI